MSKLQMHMWIEGRVQGVCFRYHTQKAAIQFEITGWVRNLSDGRVEIVAQGKSASLKKFLDECKKGPELAQVSQVTTEMEPIKQDFLEFQIANSF